MTFLLSFLQSNCKLKSDIISTMTASTHADFQSRLSTFKIMLQWASVAPMSSSFYIWTCDVIVIIFNRPLYTNVYIVTTLDSNICWQIKLGHHDCIGNQRVLILHDYSRLYSTVHSIIMTHLILMFTSYAIKFILKWWKWMCMYLLLSSNYWMNIHHYEYCNLLNLFASWWHHEWKSKHYCSLGLPRPLGAQSWTC